ncbi:phosphoribosylanthranilate isomerase [Paenibacillus cellulosilyticus]|uniref:N-(5'-phosphoribosyl)anthranilate isomerase n=1 Tax=Paenibacillus cellulosilyticus TaxID=375489 RepID=A0A2V2YW13_9BACL|nr:phosphoribosylanthranilate isomerase [Paenibacillus cellulosilyticus]PWW05541.1 phosphoribosylanthranilate isomerase [Paenibacillus cellulosilyticus]QKS45423.1 phosphoribosylanthranilate isomerase [Paenibacillus cellulosilyticus]
MTEASHTPASQDHKASTSYTRIKICGLRDQATIRAMHGLDIEAVGFIFAPSKRQLSAELAAELIAEVRAWPATTSSGRAPLAVGVFVNADLAVLAHAVNTASLDVVQLHGSETPEDCEAAKRELGTQVWKVFHLGRGGESDVIDAMQQLLPYKGYVDAVLIDTAGGGTGTVFDWTVIDRYKEAAAELRVPLYVAGGLSLDNVQSLVKTYNPGGVDISSGVETDGVKDIDKINTFVRKVWEA